ncbi:hypothetical protein Nepgr_018323 [Nepenthes gracilis]|uniref:BHLH domain-containing protein n=1 Tax=Nepenthes gracilis TaxID=150966 RepID=A0AAD3XSZ4_NEPGR|nr:hypothetical protein Nepgr_018323 [Nepenthes gracilis]
MDDDGNKRRMLNCSSSVNNTIAISEKVVTMAPSSGATFKSPQGGESLYDPGWDPNVSWSHSENFGCSSSKVSHDIFANSSYPILLEKPAVSSTSHLFHCRADPNVTEMLPKLPIFLSGNFSEMVESFGLTGCGQTSDVVCPRSFTLNKNGATEDSSLGAAQALGDFPVSKDRLVAVSPNGKRRAPDPPSFDPKKNAQGDSQENISGETSQQKDTCEKKQKIKQNSGAKQTGNEAKVNSRGGDAPKEDYIRVRARRGEATNSHSLAERVRREKISERMRLLQELVPGCNKITGKAVMLDEIINYVQSLQQQVEFLSMKLATVDLELNFNIDQIPLKDILHSQGGGTSINGFHPGTSSSHPYSQGFHLSNLLGISNITSQYHPMPQAMWDSDLHSPSPRN